MADYVAAVLPSLSGQAGTSGARHTLAGRSANVTGGVALPATSYRGILLSSLAAATATTGAPAAVVRQTYLAALPDNVSGFWFEKMHSNPAFFELGNMLSTVTRDIEIYSSYREDVRQLQTATNNAGAGVSFSGLPGLPVNINPQTSLTIQVVVSTSGPPLLDGTLDFGLDTEDLSIPITGVRVVMFPYEPESPLRETLEFLTTVITSANGKEQRVAIRKAPRQIFDMEVYLEEGADRRKLQTLLFGWHPGIFGVPVWFEARHLAADITAGETTIQVDTTYADFRDNSLAIVWTGPNTYDALEVNSHTDTSITFSSAVLHDHVAGQALVMPLRVALLDDSLPIARYRVDLEKFRLPFRVVDNDIDLADTSAFPTYNGKVLLSEANMMTGETLPADITRELLRLDNEVAAPVQGSDWPGGHFVTRKGFFCNSAQRKWEVRQLLHALRGRQVSFYMPTFYHDLVLTSDLVGSSDLMDIENVGYSTYVDAQAPNNHVRIELADGTVYMREILSATEVSETVERLTVDSAWPSTIDKDDVARISYLRLGRIAEDNVVFEHTNAGEARVVVGVREVSR